MNLFDIFRKTAATFLTESKNYIWQKSEGQRLEKFRNTHLDQDCFIICNGPSLNTMDLSLLNDYHTFGLNKIYLLFDRIKIDLTYQVSVNEYVIEQSAEVFNKTKWPLFLEHAPGKKYVKKRENVYYIKGSRPIGFYPDISEPISQGYTVTFVAMQIAFFMGFKNVYLIGCDHNFAQKGKPNELQKMEGEDHNHFDPNYFKGMKWQLADLDSSEIAYFSAKGFYENNERTIWNATNGGKLEIFPRIDYVEALKNAKKRV
jgi:hypothetical protein